MASFMKMHVSFQIQHKRSHPAPEFTGRKERDCWHIEMFRNYQVLYFRSLNLAQDCIFCALKAWSCVCVNFERERWIAAA